LELKSDLLNRIRAGAGRDLEELITPAHDSI